MSAYHYPIATAAALLAVALSPPKASGQAAAPASSAPEELYVIGQRLEETTPQELARFGNRLETLSAADLELGGFDDVSQSLQMKVPSLYLAPKNGPFDYMNCALQGSRCEDVLWLVDGVRTNNRLYNTTAPLDTISAHAIERIEVLYGGQGILYGTQSVAGVVNIVTKSFSNDPTGSLALGFDENNGTHLAGDYRNAFGDHQVVLFASKDESDGFQPFADEDYQPSSTDRERGYDVLTLGAKYAYDFTDRSRVSLLYQHTDNEIDNSIPYQAAVRNNARLEDWITAKWDYTANDNVDLYVKAYWHDWDTEWDDITNDLDANGNLTGTQTVNYLDTFWGFEDYGVTASARIRTDGAFEYAVGYDYQSFWGNDEVWLIEDKTETANAVYGQIRSAESAFANTDFAFGVRYNTTSGNADATVWNLSGQHQLGTGLYVRGQTGTSFRLPDAEELYLRDCCEVGNPNLEAEESANVEIGIGGSAGDMQQLTWQFIVFQREVDNLIDIDFDNPAFPDGRFENFDETADFNGWEIELGVAFTASLRGSLGYTSTEAQFEGSRQQIQDIPESLTKAGLDYSSMSVPFEFSLSLVNTGDVYDQVSSVGRIEHGGYTVVDLGAAYYLDQERRHRIGARLENALDEDYATSLARGRRDVGNVAYPYRNLGAPRTLHATYSYRF